jgi:CxxC motif-containing protein (DUF1111 family)
MRIPCLRDPIHRKLLFPGTAVLFTSEILICTSPPLRWKGLYCLWVINSPRKFPFFQSFVQAGSIIFNQINCSGYHRPTITTGPDFNLPQLSGQRIHPYTDLLVHDMGTGLADNCPDYLATGSEWKTQALWGLGLLQKTTGTAFYLHDGRARTIEEAILWHDGEAGKSKRAFTVLSAQERNQLMKFLNSL